MLKCLTLSCIHHWELIKDLKEKWEEIFFVELNSEKNEKRLIKYFVCDIELKWVLFLNKWVIVGLTDRETI